MFQKTVAFVTALCFLGSSFLGICPVWAADQKENEEDDAKFERTIIGEGNEGWSVVDVRRVEGTLVVLSPVVGKEIDLEESNRYALFQGGTVFTNKIDLPILKMGVSGFQSAVFMKRADGKTAMKIQFRSGERIESRLVNLRKEEDLGRLREYIEHFTEVVKGEYAISDSLLVAAEYPKYTDETVSFEESRPRFPVRMRMPGGVTLKDGKKLRGEFVPVYEEGRILIETDLSIQKVAVSDIQEVIFSGEAGSAAMGKAIMQGVGGAASGALLGAFAAWQTGSDVKETVIWAAAIFGTFGFITGLFTGAKATQSGEKFVLGPVEGKKRKS